MKIDKIEAARRTILMMADFLHREPPQLRLEDNLRKKWFMTDKDLEVLEIWIEGPISQSIEGYFQDVRADVRVADLQDPETVSTIDSLVELIWANIPDDNKAN